MPDFESDLPFDIDELMRDSVTEIFRHEDFNRYQAWLRNTFKDHLHSDILMGPVPAEELRSLATMLGLHIWNATPLPGEKFKVRNMPFPGPTINAPAERGKNINVAVTSAMPLSNRCIVMQSGPLFSKYSLKIL